MADFSDLSTFDLIELVNDFNKNFANRKIKMTTNYKYLKEFTISIEEDNLPHLIGLHYVSRNRQARIALTQKKSHYPITGSGFCARYTNTHSRFRTSIISCLTLTIKSVYSIQSHARLA